MKTDDVPGVDLMIGTATCDLTPTRPVALEGQLFTRVSTAPLTPITASIVALESREGDQSLAQCVIVSVDLAFVVSGIVASIRASVSKALPDFDATRLIVSATHTHNAPVATFGLYHIPDTCMPPEEYVPWAVARIAHGVVEAWNRRVVGQFSHGLGHAIVAHNRRVVYADGSVAMYGEEDDEDSRGVEDVTDPDVNTMFFWDDADRLLAIVINVSCPAQEVEDLSQLHADFWHPTRQMLKRTFGEGICIVPLCGAAGDTSPHLPNRHADGEDRTLRRGLLRLNNIARDIVRSVEGTYEAARAVRTSHVHMRHVFVTLSLPRRRIGAAEYHHAGLEAARLKKVIETDPYQTRAYRWHREILARYEAQRAGEVSPVDVPIHIVRIGDTAVATNPFELFTAYGLQMKARSKARQTFVVQLTDGYADYLPTPRAEKAGGYGADARSTLVGSEGGQRLVEESLRQIEALFE